MNGDRVEGVSDRGDLNAASDLYPDRWLREQRGGYGFVQRVPCRVLTQTAERIKIAVASQHPAGGEVVRYVKREKVERGR